MSISNKYFAALLFVAAFASPAEAQTNAVRSSAGQTVAEAQHIEEVRSDCIANRKRICGRIIKILPEGLVVDGGYSDLMRPSFNHSWLVPSTVTAMRAANMIEQKQPEAMCVGLVFLTDLPKGPGPKPKINDYVDLIAFPDGDYTYTSVGDLKRTVRRFSTKLIKSVQWKLAHDETPPSTRLESNPSPH